MMKKLLMPDGREWRDVSFDPITEKIIYKGRPLSNWECMQLTGGVAVSTIRTRQQRYGFTMDEAFNVPAPKEPGGRIARVVLLHWIEKVYRPWKLETLPQPIAPKANGPAPRGLPPVALNDVLVSLERILMALGRIETAIAGIAPAPAESWDDDEDVAHG
jgi:hypothetical protein